MKKFYRVYSVITMNLMHNELACWLALLNTPSVGPATFFKLREYFPQIMEIYHCSQQELAKRGVNSELAELIAKPNWSAVEKALAWQAQAENHHILKYSDPAYPALLQEALAYPPILFVQGNLSVLASPQLAMIGSRNPTRTGEEIAHQFAEHLSIHGLTITSGLAMGIDGASHKGALAAKGKTIAVLGTGIDHIYPSRHKSLAIEIVAMGGALVTEFMPGTLPRPENFPRRNRIISGLSLGVLVVEAALQSGSLITARYAVEQNREVFAIPGSIHNPLSKGCHTLIKQGAKLVETADDITDELRGFLVSFATAESLLHKRHVHNTEVDEANTFNTETTLAPLSLKHKLLALDKVDAKLVECVGYEPTAIDTIIERSGMSAESVLARLLLFELQGYVMSVHGGYMRKFE